MTARLSGPHGLSATPTGTSAPSTCRTRLGDAEAGAKPTGFRATQFDGGLAGRPAGRPVQTAMVGLTNLVNLLEPA